MRGKRLLGFLLSTLLVMGSVFTLAGCQGAASSSSSPSVTVSQSSTAATRAVKTQDGTEYTVPSTVNKVAPTIGALAQITEMLGNGTSKISAAPTQQISEKFKSVLSAYVASNPNNYDSTNVEQIIQSGAQVAFGPSRVFSDEQKAQLQAANVVFVPMDSLSSVDDICNTTLLIGQILGSDEEKVAQQFVSYWKANISDAQARTASLKDSDKPSVLNLSYSNGAWTTESGSSLIGSYIEAAGGVNVVKDYSVQSQGGPSGGAAVDEEQIVAWNPDYIITYSAEATQQIMNSATLKSVKAVQQGHVYTSPKGLYLWSVRSGEGALMAPWLGTIIHPDLFNNVDMTKMTQSFFKTYYAYALNDEDTQKVLQGTY